MSVQIGRWRLDAIHDGTFAVDGGGAFGIVPRPVWSRVAAPDAQDRIRLAARSLLCRDDDGRVLLVDAGLGEGLDPAFAARIALDRSGGTLTDGLRALGVAPEEVTDLLLTHLHFDHAGGTFRPGPGGRAVPTFPRAAVHVQRRAWQWAQRPTLHDRAAFRPAAFEPLAHGTELHLVDGEGELLPDLELVVSEGHSAALQLPRIRGDGTHLTFCSDLVPLAAHLRAGWGMAFDLLPATAIEEKRVLLAEALEDDGILVLGHDPAVVACRLAERDGAPAFREPVAL